MSAPSPRRGPGALLCCLLVLLGTVLGPAGAARADESVAATAADRVLVIGVPGLTWADVDQAATPELWQLAEESAIGSMSVRASRSTSCVLDGWATLGAGNRTRVPGPDNGLTPVPLPGSTAAPGDPAAPTTVPPDGPLDTSLSYCGLQERLTVVGLEDPVAAVARATDDPGTVRFGAEPGVLGAQVGCATYAGRAAALAVAAPGVPLTGRDALPTEPAELTDFLSGCRLNLVSLDALINAGRPGLDRTADGTDPESRAAALTRIDEALGRLRTAVDSLPGSTLVLLQGISEVNDGRPQLHVGMVSGPGFTDRGWLSSASTGRIPFVQLIDVAPTVLRALGEPEVDSFNGQPMRTTADRPELAAALDELRSGDTAAAVHYRNTSLFFWSFVAISAAVVAAGLVVLGGWRRPTGGRWGRAGRPATEADRGWGGRATRTALRVTALATAALPISTYLAGLVPWERSDSPLVALVATSFAVDAVVVALALGGPWRRRRLGPGLVVVGVTLLTPIADVLTGSTLELDAPLGYNPIVAGRFVGFGNLTFGLLSVSALLVTAAAATAVGRRVRPERHRRAVTAVVVLGGVLVVGTIGAPPLGRDFGGVLAMLPGFGVLALLLTHTGVTVVRILAILGTAVLVVGSVAVLDWLGPADDRSHLGRFVEQVITGEAWTVIHRKGDASIGILLRSPLSWMLPVAAVAAFWLVRPGGLLRNRRPADADATAPAAATAPALAPAAADAERPVAAGRAELPAADVLPLRAGLVSAALSLFLGSAVNDSGVAIAATAAIFLVPLLVWLAAGPPDAGAPAGNGTDGARAAAGSSADAVTVGSRGSPVDSA